MISPTDTRHRYPRKQHAMMRIDYNTHTVITEGGDEFTLPAAEAWELLHQIKTGEIYDDCI